MSTPILKSNQKITISGPGAPERMFARLYKKRAHNVLVIVSV